MALAAASFRHFDAEEEEWELYKEQLEQYFVSNSIQEATKKAVLINHLSSKTYKLLRDLCTPTQPKDKTYVELCTLLSTHFTPPVIVHKERRIFSRAQRNQDGPETVNEWIARIKNLAANCRFGNYLPQALVNKFVDGLDGKAFDRICEEDDTLTLEKAQEIALKYEIDNTVALGHHYVKGSSNDTPRGKVKTDRQRGTARKDDYRCFVCNKTGHMKRECKFKDYTCRGCGVKGHLQAACDVQRTHYVRDTSAQATITQENGGDRVELQQNYLSKSKTDFCNVGNLHGIEKPIVLEVEVGRDRYSMELDSGAAISVISRDMYEKKLSAWKLRKTSVRLMGYSGQPLDVLGCIFPVLCYKGQKRSLVFVVIENGGPPLLGRNFISAFGIVFSMVNNVRSVVRPNVRPETNKKLNELIQNHEELFSDGLGCFRHGQVKIELEGDANPVFKKPRQVPSKFQEQVIRELDKMEAEGIITKCDSSQWGTPLVPVIKSDGTVRLCGDYKVTVNKNVKDVKHPLPSAEEIFSKLNGGQKFSKLDLSRCYNQFELDEESKGLCAISTMKGVFLMNRLPFGIKPASGIVQRELEKLLCGIPGVQNFLDDVMVTGSSDEEHLERLRKVFEVLQNAGFKLNKAKCEFFKSEVTFLGYVVDKDGLRKTDERMKAIRDAPEPKNVSEVRAFAGLVNYYSKFVRGLADIMSPLYKLLKKNVRFVWTSECSAAFKRIKDEICRDVSLAHFDPHASIFLTCDASNVGVSAVLSQKMSNGVERPVAFASRKLHAAEANYSVIDREALAIMYGLNKFFFYLAGNKFVIRTDHKPLLSLLHPQKGIPTIAASRMQRWAHFLSGFSYSIEHVGSQQNIADFASRFPTESWTLWKEGDSYLNFINQPDCELVDQGVLVKEISNDEQLGVVLQVLKGELPLSALRDNPYRRFVDELSLESGTVMRGHRVVVPLILRKKILEQLHKSHLGIVKSKSVARSSVWWPELDRDLEEFIKDCPACLIQSHSPAKAKLIPWEPPVRVWSRLHIDFAGPVKGMSYLIIVDALSKWVEVFPTKCCTSEFVLDKLVECISRFGLFDELVSDNGTQFVASNVQAFLKANGIRHRLTSPGHPATNGEAENMVKTFKNSLLKCLKGTQKSVRSIVANFLIGYRKSIHCTTRMSPSQMMLGRDLKTSLDLMQSRAAESSKQEGVAKGNILRKQQVQIRCYRGTRDVRFKVGDPVIVRDYTDPNKASWTSAVIVEVEGPRNYYVRLSKSGRIIKRHLNQIKSDTRRATQQDDPQALPAAVKRDYGPVKRSNTAWPHREDRVRAHQEFESVPEIAEPSPSAIAVEAEMGNPSEQSLSGGNMVIPNTGEVERELDPEEGEELGLEPNQVEGNRESIEVAVNSESSEEEFDSASDNEGLVVSGFERGFWRLRDKQGRIFKR